MQTRGSQKRETLAESGLILIRKFGKQAITYDGSTFELLGLNDDFAGHVLEIDGKGYEFQRSLTWDEARDILARNERS